MLQVTKICRWWAIAKMHPAFTVGPAIQRFGRYLRGIPDGHKNRNAAYKTAEAGTRYCAV